MKKSIKKIIDIICIVFYIILLIFLPVVIYQIIISNEVPTLAKFMLVVLFSFAEIMSILMGICIYLDRDSHK